MGISLRRKTSGGSYIAAIDGLRFVAIMGVVLFHAREYALGSTDGALGALASRGWFGVELFFVISGVVLALPLAKHFLSGTPRPSLRRFYLSRFTRIGPPYWIALLVYLVGKASLGQHGLFPNFLASSCYVHNLVYGRGSLVCGVAWTLEIEVQFYLISPFIGQVFAIRNRSVRRATLGLSILAFTLLSARLDSGFPYLLPYMFYFLAGYLLADIYVADLSVEKPPAPDWRWDVLGSVAWLALWIWLDYRPAILRIAVPWLILVAYLAAFRGPLSRWFFSLPVIYLTGGMCYTIYLYHSFMLRVLIHRTPIGTLPFPLLVAVAVPIVLLTCVVPYLLLERPFMGRYASKRKPAVSVDRSDREPQDVPACISG